MNPEDLLRLVADGLGVDGRGLAKADLLKRIEQGLHATAREGRRTLLIVDEVQALPTDSLAELRMLSNIQAGRNSLPQLVQIGRESCKGSVYQHVLYSVGALSSKKKHRHPQPAPT